MDCVTMQNAVQKPSGATEDGQQATTPLDHAHLSRYTLSDRTLEYEILRLFLAQIPLTLESLRFASMDRDWVVAAHTLKGSARAVGVWGLAELALEAEQLGGIADESACRNVIARIESAAQDIARYVANHYGS